MEVSAAIVFLLTNVTNGALIQLEVTSDGEEPEDENVAYYQDSPVHHELDLLLTGDLGSALIEA